MDLAIWPGEWLAVVGPSGSGKSTLLNVLGLLDRQTEGTYRLDGVDVNELDDLARAGLRGRRIGFIFQAFHLLPHRTVLENVMLAELYVGAPRRGRQERALEALERVGLGDRADFLPTRLSGGQRQRAAIARALMAEPSLLLCDEPTGNLDSKSAANVLDILGELTQQRPDADRHHPRRARRRPGRPARPHHRRPARRSGAGAGMSDLQPRLAPRDLVEEALASLTARPGRAVLTALGTVLGVAALVATLGLSKTAGNQIVGRFDALAATDIVVTPKAAGAGRAGGGNVLPWDAEARATPPQRGRGRRHAVRRRPAAATSSGRSRSTTRWPRRSSSCR